MSEIRYWDLNVSNDTTRLLDPNSILCIRDKVVHDLFRSPGSLRLIADNAYDTQVEIDGNKYNVIIAFQFDRMFER